jgi:hypothetical protein
VRVCNLLEASRRLGFAMTSPVLPLSFAAGAARFDESQPGWTLLDPGRDGGEFRTFAGQVLFERVFKAPPLVHVGITGFDIDHRDNARLHVGISSIDEQGFRLELRTWWNTRLWSVELNWLAIGH